MMGSVAGFIIICICIKFTSGQRFNEFTVSIWEFTCLRDAFFGRRSGMWNTGPTRIQAFSYSIWVASGVCMVALPRYFINRLKQKGYSRTTRAILTELNTPVSVRIVYSCVTNYCRRHTETFSPCMFNEPVYVPSLPLS